MAGLITINIIESLLLTYFISSLLDIKKYKWLYRTLLLIGVFFIMTLSNYIDLYDMYLTTLIIMGSVIISIFFVSNNLSEIIFICCLESLLAGFTVAVTILLCAPINMQSIDVISKCIYLVLGMCTIKLIKKEPLHFNGKMYYSLSLIIFVVHFLIQHLLQMYLIINIKNMDFLISFGLLIISILALLFSIVYISSLYKDKENYQQLLKEKRNEEVLSYLYNEVKITKHDLKHDYNLIEHYIEQGDIESIRQMMLQKNNKISYIPSLVNSKNKLINTIINNKIIEAYAKKLNVQCYISVDRQLQILDCDLNQLLSNILDNAIENCIDMGEITINILQENNLLHIQVSNPIVDSSLKNNLVTKKDKRYHGFGIKSIQSICQRYHGSLNIKHQNNKFYTEITLFLKV